MKTQGSPAALGTENIWSLLLKYSIPSVIAMTASSLYNITASIFIGQGVGALAISGLAITFPLMNLAAAFGTLVGLGAANLMSLRLGQKDYDAANRILGNVIVLNIIFGLGYTVIVLPFLKPILYFFGASDNTISYAYDYMLVITLGNAVTHMYFGLNALLRAMGNPKRSMYNVIFSVCINAALTPALIYGMDAGIRGAAIATVTSQVVMMLWQFRYFTNKKNFIYIKRETLKLKRRIVTASLSIGLAPFLMNSAMSAVVILINQGLMKYGSDLAVGAYGIVNRMAMLFLMIVIGLNQGMQPIAGFNYGANQLDRVHLALKRTIMLATCVVGTGFLLVQLFPRSVASIFTTDEELIAIAVPGLRIVFASFPIVGFQMVTSSFFQSIGKAKKAIFLALTRQTLFLAPCLLIFPLFFGVKGVWYSMPTADVLSSVVSAYLLITEYRKQKNKAVNLMAKT